MVPGTRVKENHPVTEAATPLLETGGEPRCHSSSRYDAAGPRGRRRRLYLCRSTRLSVAAGKALLFRQFLLDLQGVFVDLMKISVAFFFDF